MVTRERLEDRIVELAFCPWLTLPTGLRKLGLTVEMIEGGETIIICTSNKRIGFCDVDPSTKAYLIATAICNSYLFEPVFPGLTKKIKTRWEKK